MKLNLKYSQEFKNIVEKRAKEIILSGEKEGIINDSFYGRLRVYVGKKPTVVIFSATVDGHQIHVGGNER